MNNDKVINVLNDLIETCKDGEYGFRQSQEHAKSNDLIDLFSRRAADCAQAARDLQTQVKMLGGKADDDGSVGGAIHRGWVAVRSTLSTYTDLALLQECERGEDKALNSYKDALKESLPDSIRQLVQAQYAGAQRNHDQIRALRDRYKTMETA